jgi:hypothetical protein
MTPGRRMKWLCCSTSASFLIPAYILASFFHPSATTWIIGLFGGLLWANWFEYAYHRWADHKPGSYFEKEHRKHHAHPEDEEHVNLGGGPALTAGMFIVNGLPVVLADIWLRVGFSAPVLVAFVIYVLAMEETHWRVHMGGWIPKWVLAYHLSHHAMGEEPTGGQTKFNIFVPLFDWVCGTMG